jgi:hypothetical protein
MSAFKAGLIGRPYADFPEPAQTKVANARPGAPGVAARAQFWAPIACFQKAN